MNILLLYTRIPYPIDQGANLRVFYLLKEISKWANIHLICYGQGEVPEEIVVLNIQVTYFEPLVREKTSFTQGLKDVFSFDQLAPQNTKINDYILANQHEYDVFWSYFGMLRSIPSGLKQPLVVDVIDDGILEYVRSFKVEKSFRKKISQFKWALMNYLFEKKYISAAKAAVLVSEVDAEYLKKACPKTDIRVIQNGVDSDFYKPMGGEQTPETIVFEGNMSFPPNVDAVKYFVKDIFPLVLKLAPHAKFIIVGKDPVVEVKELQASNIVITGYVNDTRPYLDSAVVFVSPMRKGAGIKNKILQAWAMEKPVVATSISVGGLKFADRENIVLEDSPQKFAEAIVSLFDNPVDAKQIGKLARKMILDNYSWKSKAEEFYKLLG